MPVTFAIAMALALTAAQEPPLVIRNVTVIPGLRGGERVATVMVRDGRIVAVATPSRSEVPRGARVVDGTGRYLIPGLFDLHTHVSKSRGSSLGLFVANGVTTLRDMGGDHQELLRWQREIGSGARLGPRMLIAGPYLESATNAQRQRSTSWEEMAEPVERTRLGIGTPEDARRIVDSLAPLGISHVKIRTVQNRDTYRAIAAAARAHGLPLVGHAFGLPPDLVLEVGHRSVEHNSLSVPDTLSREGRMALWRRLAAAGVANVPTTVTATESGLPTGAQLQAIVDDSLGTLEPRRRYLSRFLIIDWREQAAEQTDERRAFFQNALPNGLRNLREMREAGVRILPGTDVGVINIYPGSTLHDELAAFVRELGFTPLEAIEAATRASAELLGLADSVGTVEVGKVADLVLLDADPRADIRNTRRIGGVFLRGRYFDRGALDAVLAGVEGAEDRRINDWPRR